MTSEWDGTPWAGMAAVTGSKAAVGPGVGLVMSGTPISLIKDSPQKRMWAAQRSYHENPWVRVAEQTVTRKVVGLPYHFEDGDGNTYDETNTSPGVQAAIDLIENPQANLTVGRPQTRRMVTSLTSRHIGLCGMGYWYLDQTEQLAGTPLTILYVNPARVWPAQDAAGNLTGWVLDAQDDQGHGGTPLTLDELLPFYLDPPDVGHIGAGLYEAARLKAHITSLADQHSAYILSTGGRLPGVYSPKDGTIPDDTFKSMVAEFRNVSMDPQAAKLSIVTQGPMDFTAAASDTSELQLVELSKMNRDDILAVWGVPPSQAGIPGAAGLNSGETKGYDEAVLMQGAVHDRVVSIKESIQLLLDRWKPLGFIIELVIDEPTFDDEAPAFALAVQALGQPLTDNERRAILGRDPIPDVDAAGEPLGAAIYRPQGYSVVGAVDENGKALTLAPKPVPLAPFQPDPFGKASGPGLRRKLDATYVPKVKSSVQKALDAQRLAIASRVRDKGSKLKSKDTSYWWTGDEKHRMTQALKPHLEALAGDVTVEVGKSLRRGKADFTERVLARIALAAGVRIRDIDETTIAAVRAAIAQGFTDGLSPAEVGDVIENLTIFDEYRAERIARTETMLAYNSAALASYQEYDVTHVLAYDGDEDEACAARDGQTFTIEEAFGIEDHPNGTLDWAPVLEPIGKAVTPPLDLAPMLAALASREAQPVNVTVAMPGPLVRTVLDFDEAGTLIGSHPVPIDG